MGKLRAGIIGCGRIGVGRGSCEGPDRYYTHAGAYHHHPQVELAAAADPDASRRSLARQAWEIQCLYRDYREMLHAERLDIVSVCVPDEWHAPVVTEAIEAGCRAIFCEKPFTLDLSDALRAVQRCEEQGIVLAVNHQRRWDAGHQQVRAWIEAGELGTIQRVRGLYSGGWVHVGCQLVDLLRFLIGEVAEAELLAVVDPQAQALDVRLQFQQGASAVLHACQQQHFEVFEVDILGTAGRVQLVNFGHRILRWQVGQNPEYGGDTELSHDPLVVETNLRMVFSSAVDDIIRCLGSGGEPRCSGRDAARTVDILQRVVGTAHVLR